MDHTRRISYKSNDKKGSEFEIIPIRQFFETRSPGLLERDFRLNFWMLIYVTEGGGLHSIDFKEYPCKKGDLVVVSKNQVHSFRVNFSMEGYIINIDESFFMGGDSGRNMNLMAFFEVPFGKPVMQVDSSPESTNRQLIELIYKEYLRAEDVSSQLLISSLFSSFVYSIRHEEEENIKKIGEAAYRHYYYYKELLEKHIADKKSVTYYAGIMGISRKTLNEACQECVGLSSKQVIINKVILETKKLLVQGKMLNYEISERLGFDEPANLAGFFKRNTGMPMREFREQYGS